MKSNKKCVICDNGIGEVFNNNTLTCSKDCKRKLSNQRRKKWWNKNKRKPKVEKECIICGNKFLTNRVKITCSNNCSQKNGINLCQKWTKNNRIRINELARLCYQRHKEKIREKYKIWWVFYKQNNLDKIRIKNNIARKKYEKQERVRLMRKFYRHNRRADIKSFFNVDLWKEKLNKLEHKCQICLNVFPENKLEIDHIIPITKGGIGTLANIQPLCRSCNAKKGNRTSL